MDELAKSTHCFEQCQRAGRAREASPEPRPTRFWAVAKVLSRRKGF
ncbi:MAG: hypothetical protein FD161_1883 [Limisphaerales bacterium]|nr:MAG: hypothetical protein FD161_1883 [Limisphaerales bacterium]